MRWSRQVSQRVFARESLDNRLKAGLIGHWLGTTGSGSSLQDFSGYGNHGTFTGSPKWTLGFQNRRAAVQTAAGTDQMSCGSSSLFANLGPLSVAAWVYTTSLTAEQGIVEHMTNTASAGWGFVIDASTGTLDYFTLNAGNSASYISTPALSTNTWYHVGFTLTAQISGTGTIYINGASVALGTNTAGLAYADDSAANFSISGRDFDTSGLVGIIDDVRLYNRVLSSAEMTTLANPSFMPVAGRAA